MSDEEPKLGRRVTEYVIFTVLTAACGLLVDWGVEAIKERRRKRHRRRKKTKPTDRRPDF
jgi:hypothetical protein